ncbi:monovalent cation/H+ antiporter complex subunit F [Echinicola jeungdonensis]|uniref:Monovalent cation/H+ antiporter complex subunit F n=1 Tax=Echinicola jeungdonensis TaxID=709343 RepID=A0ABV5J298_9BACT|nr:monovalent cation/H+ antiporter complex subunit F [Echinicola jeungdonensis]MDN3671064.1 monovalent cation/H+ antiporter complex subunit F [Echinicola jeungdonensis]
MSIYYLLLTLAIGVLFIGVMLTMIRFLIGPTLPDRIISLDLLSSMLIGILALYSIVSGVDSTLEVALVLSLITFLGTMVFANYLIEKMKK